MDSNAAALAMDFLRLNEFLRTGGTRTPALQRLVDLAVTAVPGCDWAAVTAWPDKAGPRSLAYSADVAFAADRLQYDVGDGPCLTAADDDKTVLIADLDQDERWPAFRAAALARTPVRSVASFHLAEPPERTALNLYSAHAWPDDTDAFTIASLFAAHARVLLLHANANAKATHLTTALTTSRQIGAAVGILMNVHKITEDGAFTLLHTTSQHLNRKLHLVAEDVTRTGALPTGD